MNDTQSNNHLILFYVYTKDCEITHSNQLQMSDAHSRQRADSDNGV